MAGIYNAVRVLAFVAFLQAILSVLISNDLLRTFMLIVSACVVVCGVLVTYICDTILASEHKNQLLLMQSPKHVQIATDCIRSEIFRERLTLLVTYAFALFSHFVVIHFSLLEKLS